ncbi:hypothetical protein BDZ89DRAFT_1137560 [Hymenopellis radicata]|nr:hypothetical protein BDZ89DRAFT_1137560 [Hymenopellis radicata]
MSLPPSIQTPLAFDVPQPPLVFTENAIENIRHRVPKKSLNRVISHSSSSPSHPTLLSDTPTSFTGGWSVSQPAPHPLGQAVEFIVNYRLHGGLSDRIIESIPIPLQSDRRPTMRQMLDLITRGPMGRYIYQWYFLVESGVGLAHNDDDDDKCH